MRGGRVLLFCGQGSYDTEDSIYGVIFQLGDSLLFWLVQV